MARRNEDLLKSKKKRGSGAVPRKPHKLEVARSIPAPATDLEEFQAAYGDEWIRTIQSPHFRSAMLVISLRKFASLTNLSNEMIEKNGREILSNLVGHLQHENDLMTLHEKRESKFPWEETEEYYSPEQVAQFEALAARFREQTKKVHYAS